MALVVFRSKAAGEIFMFAETARCIFEILGRQEAPRGVITAEQVPDALRRLVQAVEDDKAQLKAAQEEADLADKQGDVRGIVLRNLCQRNDYTAAKTRSNDKMNSMTIMTRVPRDIRLSNA